MKAIWKYTLPIADWQQLEMPKGSKILSVVAQYNLPVVYALVDTEESMMERRLVWIRGTGHCVDGLNTEDWIATLVTMGGQLVWHVFIELQP
ncbi:hypothetical protein LCGC14_2056590 [marine sediment metagenome]|uniref:DUF7352 domain-containing protein n=1 Tax=marine sediment metagenome TaxID=412755 RepID=A0A0F9FA01_9ZZZZ